MKYVFLIIGIVILYLIITSILKLARLKKNIIESKLGMNIYFKRKENIVENIHNYLKTKDPDKLSSSDFINIEEFIKTKEIERKIVLGSLVSKDVNEFVNKNYHLKADGEISAFINSLMDVDEKILEFNKKYNLSVLAYDIARKKSIVFFIFKKHEKSKDTIDFYNE